MVSSSQNAEQSTLKQENLLTRPQDPQNWRRSIPVDVQDNIIILSGVFNPTTGLKDDLQIGSKTDPQVQLSEKLTTKRGSIRNICLQSKPLRNLTPNQCHPSTGEALYNGLINRKTVFSDVLSDTIIQTSGL